jgi:hypothetical protein
MVKRTTASIIRARRKDMKVRERERRKVTMKFIKSQIKKSHNKKK